MLAKVALLATCIQFCNAQLVLTPPGYQDQPASNFAVLGDHHTTEDSVVLESIVKTHLPSPDNVCDPAAKQYSGYISFPGSGDPTTTSYFFWMFESRTNPHEDPVILWMTGGPGCSGEIALLAENGPCLVNKDGTGTVRNKYSWTEQASVIWVDQPAGTGFSTGPYVHDEVEVANAMYKFLQALFARTELSKFRKCDFFIFGESYAGHYVPSVAHRILQGQNREGEHINLKGVAIGNGMTDPQEQYKWYPQMAEDGGKSWGGSLERGAPVSAKTLKDMRNSMSECIDKIEYCNDGFHGQCKAAFAFCNAAELDPVRMSNMNIYDLRITCGRFSLCYDFNNIKHFLNSRSVQNHLGVKGHWELCNMQVNSRFHVDWMHNHHTLLPDLLAREIRVLIYAGDTDYICNWLGNKHWALKLEWPYAQNFIAAEDKPYKPAGFERAAGRLRTSNGFSFLQIYQSGHMVPMDQPAVALDMVIAFLGNKLADRTVESSSIVV